MTTRTLPQGRYLVTGGAGFLGSHLCDAILAKGGDVVCVDNFITGAKGNVSHLKANGKFQLLEADIIKPLKVDGSLAGIFHFASPASPIDYAKYPIETLRVGSIGSDHVLQLAAEKKCPVLVASTSEVYGDPLEHPQKESYWGNVNPIGPRGCYDESKRYLEALTMAYRRKHEVQTRIIRIFNTYGPRMRTDDGRVVPQLCLQALRNEPLSVNGDGKQTRSFCYVSDLIEGIILAFGKGHPEPINLGNPTEYTILDFAKVILEMVSSKSKITFHPMPVDDPKTRQPDITRAKTLLGWEPKIGLQDGLKKTVEYFRSTL